MSFTNHQQVYRQTQQKAKIKLILLLANPINKWKKLASASKNRYFRFQQLITTQEDYFNDLKALKQKVKDPLIRNEIISQQKANHMFNNLQNMMELSLKLRSGLIDKFKHWDQRKTVFGEYMIKFSSFFILYSDYFKNFMQTQRTLNQLLKNPRVRQIETSLSTEKKIVTIQDLLAKPFQRSLKYKEILSQYLQKLDKSHPDYYHMKNATISYQMVSEKNNMQMQHKQKDTILMDLHSKYSKIIESQARFYVDQYHANCIDVPVIVYLFSDFMLLAYQNTQKEKCRVYLNKYSLASISNNNKKYINGLYLYGNGGTVFLTFKNTLQRDNMHLKLKNMIKNISENQFSREKIIALRVTRTDVKKSAYLPQRQAQLALPLICRVVGIQNRRVSQDTVNEYYVIEFKGTPKNQDIKFPPQQISLVSWQKLQKIQKFIRNHYENEVIIFSLKYLPKDITEQMLTQNQELKYQVRSIIIQLFLNQIFREEVILKKIDIICRQLDICDALWRYLGPHAMQVCFCQLCILKPYYQTYDEYHYEITKRLDLSKRKKKKCSQFCEIRTVASQIMITNLPLNNLQSLNKIQRLYWMRARQGFIDHSLTNIRPFVSMDKLIKLVVWYHNINGNNFVQLQLNPYSRVKFVVDKVGQILNFDLSDYTLQLQLGGNKYLLQSDQVIGNVYVEQHQRGLISRLVSIFTDQNFPQTFFLRKLWILQPKFQFGTSIDKVIFQVQQIIYKIVNGQIQVSMEDIQTIFACYLAYHNHTQSKQLKSAQSKQQLLQLKSHRYKYKLNYQQISNKISKVNQDNKIRKEDFLYKIISTVICRPGWSCPMFKALQKTSLGYYIIRVRIGCDLKGIHVYHDACIKKKYEFKHQQKYWSIQLIGQQMTIKHPQGTLYFKGRQLWKLQDHINFYQIYYRTFIAK